MNEKRNVCLSIIIFCVLLLSPSTSLSGFLLDRAAQKSLEENGGVRGTCGFCHGPSHYLTVKVFSIDGQATMESGKTATVTATVEVTGSHKYSVSPGFSLMVKIVSLKRNVAVPSPQSLSKQMLTGRRAPFTWTRSFQFEVTGSSVGTDTLKVIAKMIPNHGATPRFDSASFTTDVIVPSRNDAYHEHR